MHLYKHVQSLHTTNGCSATLRSSQDDQSIDKQVRVICRINKVNAKHYSPTQGMERLQRFRLISAKSDRMFKHSCS